MLIVADPLKGEAPNPCFFKSFVSKHHLFRRRYHATAVRLSLVELLVGFVKSLPAT